MIGMPLVDMPLEDLLKYLDKRQKEENQKLDFSVLIGFVGKNSI